MDTSSISAARRLLDSLRGRDDSGREGLAQIHRALDLAEAHDACAASPAIPERPLHERALASVSIYATRLPPAIAELLFEAIARLAVLERERGLGGFHAIRVKVAADLEEMSLDELIGRFNTQRRTIEHLLAGRASMTDKLIEILKNVQEEPWTGA